MTEQKSDTTIELAALLAGLAKLPEYEKRIAVLESRLATLEGNAKETPIIPKGRKWASLKEAAQVLGVSSKTVRRYVERGLLRRNASLRHIQILAEDLDAMAGKVAFSRC